MGIIRCAAGKNQGVRCWYLLFGQTRGSAPTIGCDAIRKANSKL